MTASERNPLDVPRRVAEYIREVQASDPSYYWYAYSVERDGNRYVIDFSCEEDHGYFEPAWGSDWVPDVRTYYRRDVVEYVGRRVAVEVISISAW